MRNISISVSEPQYKFLSEQSKKLGISIGELIRRIVDEWKESK